MMSHLIGFYNVFSMIFELSICYSLDATFFFLNTADGNFDICFYCTLRDKIIMVILI